MHIYMLSGLGAGRRVFDFLGLSGYHVHHVEWVKPEGDETIQHYAQRLVNQIHHDSPVLIGVSFGGLVAVEIAKIIPVKKIILISSVKTKSDIPLPFHLLNWAWLRKFLGKLYDRGNLNFIYWLFSADTETEKELLRTSFYETNRPFLSWAMDKIATWENQKVHENAVVIHGTHDRIFPLRSANLLVHGGGHLMVVSKAKELTSIIKKILTSPKFITLQRQNGERTIL